ncbi:MAG: hypothetical protein AAGC53_01995 [Actinomycetota bacterium]
MIPELTRVLDPSYLTDLAAAPIDQVRSMRVECADLENGASFVRRLAQGRIDVLLAETKRRAEGGGGSLGELIDSLASTLSDGSVAGPGSGRADQELEPPEQVVDPLTEVLDERVPPSVVTSVADLDDDSLATAIIGLRDFEEELSAARHSLHETIDSVNNELARRIAGGASPAGLE